MQNMLVSIIIPCYNAEKFVHECIESCLNQTYGNIEIICVNDGSKDNTLAILENFKRKNKIQVFDQTNKGACAARNLGLEHSNGDYIQFLDADDVLLPEKISYDIEKIIETSFPLMLVGSFRRIEKNGKQIDCVYQENYESPWVSLFKSDLGNTCSNLFSTKLFETNKIQWREDLKSSQEYTLMFEILKTNPTFCFSNHIQTIIHRRDNASISTATGHGNLERWILLRGRIISHLRECEPELLKENRMDFDHFLFPKLRFLASSSLFKAWKIKRATISPQFTPKTNQLNSTSYVRFYKLFGFLFSELMLKLK